LAADIQGLTASGFDLVSHSIVPEEVVVSGPLGLLRTITEIKTDPINLGGRNGDFSMMVNIIYPNPFVVLHGSGIAEFHGVIRPSILVRNFDGIAINLTGLAPHFTADFHGRTGSLRLQGRQDQLSLFQPASNTLTVDCSNLLEPGTYTLPVRIILPEGFSIIRHEPQELTITITLSEEDL
jgi:YbbR domain-containing protein